MIMAVDAENGIGKNGKLPWHIPSEFKYFVEYTHECLCIMGRKTFEDIKGFKKATSGPLLPNRQCMVFSTEVRGLARSNTYDNVIFNDNPYNVMNMLSLSKRNDDKTKTPDICVIGGKSVYEMFSAFDDLVDEISVTYLEDSYDCDTFLDLDTLLHGFLPAKEWVDEKGQWKAIRYKRDKNESS